MALPLMAMMLFGLVRKVFTVITGSLMKALFTEKMIMSFFLMFGDWLVKRTDNKMDNEAWAKIRPEIEKTIK